MFTDGSGRDGPEENLLIFSFSRRNRDHAAEIVQDRIRHHERVGDRPPMDRGGGYGGPPMGGGGYGGPPRETTCAGTSRRAGARAARCAASHGEPPMGGGYNQGYGGGGRPGRSRSRSATGTATAAGAAATTFSSRSRSAAPPPPRLASSALSSSPSTTLHHDPSSRSMITSPLYPVRSVWGKFWGHLSVITSSGARWSRRRRRGVPALAARRRRLRSRRFCVPALAGPFGVDVTARLRRCYRASALGFSSVSRR